MSYDLFVSALYNETSVIFPEMHTDFNRLSSILMMYKHVALPEHFDEIGDRILKKYFPSGRLEDNSHLNAVDVRMLSFFFFLSDIKKHYVIFYNNSCL